MNAGARKAGTTPVKGTSTEGTGRESGRPATALPGGPATGVPGHVLRHDIVAVTAMLAGGRMKVAFRGGQAYTDGRWIVVPAIEPSQFYPVAVADVLRGYAAHESAHIRYTDFEEIGRLRDRCAALRPGECSEGAGSLGRTIGNIVEDAMIERRLIVDYPGLRPMFERMRAEMVARRREEVAVMAAEGKQHDKGTLVLDALLQGCNISNRWECRDDHEAQLSWIGLGLPGAERIARRWIDGVARLADTYEAHEAAFRITSEVLDEFMPVEPAEAAGKPDEAGGDAAANDEPGRVPGTSGNPPRDGGDPGPGPGEGEGIGGDRATPDEPSDEGPGDGAHAMDEESGPTGDASTPGDGDAAGRNPVGPDDAADGPVEDVPDEGAGKDDDSVGADATQVGDESRSWGGTDGRPGRADATSGDEAGGDDAATRGARGRTIEDGDGTAPPPPPTTGGGILDDVTGGERFGRVDTDAAAREASALTREGTATLVAAFGKAPRAPLDEVETIVHAGATRPDGVSVADPALARAVRTMVTSRSRSRVRRNRESGEFDHANVVSQSIGGPDVFMRLDEAPDPETDLVILVDQSESTRRMQPQATAVVAALAEASFVHPRLRTRVLGYTTGGEDDRARLAMHDVKGFGDAPARARARIASWRDAPGEFGYTPTAEALHEAARAFAGRPRRRRIVLLVTDGEPDDEVAALAAHAALRRQGILVAAIEVGGHHLPRMGLDACAVAEGPADLATALAKVAGVLVGGGSLPTGRGRG